MPTLGHMALVGLVKEGLVHGVISQNVDGERQAGWARNKTFTPVSAVVWARLEADLYESELHIDVTTLEARPRRGWFEKNEAPVTAHGIRPEPEYCTTFARTFVPHPSNS